MRIREKGIRWGTTFALTIVATACGPAAVPVPQPVDSSSQVRQVTGPQLRAELAGRDADVVLLNVWATWCVTCREEFPDLLRLRRAYKQRGVAVEFLSGDFPSQLANVTAFLRELDVDFPTFIKVGKDMELIEALHPDWSGALPATFLFARGGAIVQWWEGAASYEQFAAAVDRALTQPKGAAR